MSNQRRWSHLILGRSGSPAAAPRMPAPGAPSPNAAMLFPLQHLVTLRQTAAEAALGDGALKARVTGEQFKHDVRIAQSLRRSPGRGPDVDKVCAVGGHAGHRGKGGPPMTLRPPASGRATVLPTGSRGPVMPLSPPIIHAIGLVVKETADELCPLRPRSFRRAEAPRRIPASAPCAPPARDGMAQAAEPPPPPACIPPQGWTALLQKVFDAGSPRPKAGHARLPALSISAARFSRRPQRCIPVF